VVPGATKLQKASKSGGGLSETMKEISGCSIRIIGDVSDVQLFCKDHRSHAHTHTHTSLT